MGGGITSFIGGVWANVRGSNLSSLGLVILAIFLFGWGAYIAWSKEHTKFQEEEARNGKPEINCTITAGYINPASTAYKEDDKTVILEGSVVVLEVVLENLRHVPTTITGKELIFTEDNGEKYAGKWVEFVWAPYVTKENVPTQMVNYWEPPIELAITPAKPLEYAKPKKCWIRFFMDNVPAKAYSGSRVELRIRDGTGIWWPFKTLMPFKLGEMHEQVGLSPNNVNMRL